MPQPRTLVGRGGAASTRSKSARCRAHRARTSAGAVELPLGVGAGVHRRARARVGFRARRPSCAALGVGLDAGGRRACRAGSGALRGVGARARRAARSASVPASGLGRDGPLRRQRKRQIGLGSRVGCYGGALHERRVQAGGGCGAARGGLAQGTRKPPALPPRCRGSGGPTVGPRWRGGRGKSRSWGWRRLTRATERDLAPVCGHCTARAWRGRA